LLTRGRGAKSTRRSLTKRDVEIYGDPKSLVTHEKGGLIPYGQSVVVS